MNEKEWLVEMIEDFISDLNDYRGNTDEPELMPIIESMIEKLEYYIMQITNSGF